MAAPASGSVTPSASPLTAPLIVDTASAFSSGPPSPTILLRRPRPPSLTVHQMLQTLAASRKLSPADADQLAPSAAVGTTTQPQSSAVNNVLSGSVDAAASPEVDDTDPAGESRSKTSVQMHDVMDHARRSQYSLSSQRLALQNETHRLRLLVVKKPGDSTVTAAFKSLLQFLLTEFPDIKVYVHEEVIKSEAFFEVDDTFRPFLTRLRVWVGSVAGPTSTLLVPPAAQATMDLIVTLGGDGTLLHCASQFQQAMPPVMSIALGSLGFLTPFPLSDVAESVRRVMRGDCLVTLRIRLQCEVFRHRPAVVRSQRRRTSTPDSADGVTLPAVIAAPLGMPVSAERTTAAENDGGPVASNVLDALVKQTDESLSLSPWPTAPSVPAPSPAVSGGPVPSPSPLPVSVTHVLNEICIDRGPSAYLSNLDVFCNGTLITCVQGDGLIVATPTGSTAYSVAAGGSMVHPSIPAILLTPICPHSLSFRPIVVPSTVELKIQVPLGSRNCAWVSMDGRNRLKLNHGDFVRITVSEFPVPTINNTTQSTDWFNSLAQGLFWNVRGARQKGFDASDHHRYH